MSASQVIRKTAASYETAIMSRLLILGGIALLVFEAIALFNEANMMAAVPPAVIAVAFLVTNPRWAVYQFVAMIFIQVRLTESLPVSLLDVSAAIMIFAAIIDLLSRDHLPRRFPKLALGLLVLIGAVAVAACFGVRPILAVNPLARLAFLTTTMLAVYHLASRIDLTKLLHLFFWMAVIHSGIALWGFVVAVGLARSFGFSPATLAALVMMAFPIGLVATLWQSSRSKRALYLIGTLIVLGGVVATQSRFPLLMCVAVLPLTFLVMRRTMHRWSNTQVAVVQRSAYSTRRIWQRAMMLAAVLGVIGGGVVLLRPDYFDGLAWRLSQIWSFTPSGTFRLRLTLWESAWRAFSTHPITGIGPGAFRYIHEILPQTHLDAVAYWVRGLSAHNLMFHYLAETGLVGSTALVALMVSQYRFGRRLLRPRTNLPLAPVDLSLAILAGLLLLTTFLEIGWLWGQTGFIFAFVLALIARRNVEVDTAQDS